MRIRKEKVIVEVVGCQYGWDSFPSPAPLVFFCLKKRHVCKISS